MTNQTLIPTLTAADVEQAAQRLSHYVHRTQLDFSPRLSARTGARVFLKREDLQIGWSYKIRGAYNLMAGLSRAERAAGVVTASTGNHARAVAGAARQLGLGATIFVPAGTDADTLAAIAATGGSRAQVRAAGSTMGEALALAMVHARQTGAILVHPYDDPRIAAGQGSLAVELSAQLAELGLAPQVLVAPIGGGGLIGGAGVYLRSRHPQAQIIGVRPQDTSGALKSLAAPGRTAAAAAVVDQVVQIPEAATLAAVADLAAWHHIQAVPAGALAASALDLLAPQLRGQTVVVVISGGQARAQIEAGPYPLS